MFWDEKAECMSKEEKEKIQLKRLQKSVKLAYENVSDVLLRGLHNYENICAAVAATTSLVEPELQAEAIKKFQGVEHRLELVREINGVKWYNVGGTAFGETKDNYKDIKVECAGTEFKIRIYADDRKKR